MKYFTRLTKTPVVPVFFYFTFSQTLDNYIDAGTGMIILQGVIGAVAAGSIAIAVYWRKIRVFFSSRFRKGKSIEKDDDSAED